MKKIVIILVFLGSMSCGEDYLNRNSLSQLSPGTFWKNTNDAWVGINGVYDALQDHVLYGGSLNETNLAGFPMHDCFADNAYNNFKFEGPGNYVVGNADQSFGYFYNLWSSLYKGIGRANIAIENIGNMTSDQIPDAKKSELQAQAMFLRALFYFNIAVYFESAPLITKFQSLSEAYVAKNTYDEIKTQVIQDLQYAIANLPNSYPASTLGYATKGSALSLLTRFSLYNKDYQSVVDLTAQVMQLGYSLNSDYASLFTEAGETSQEIVFATRFFQNPAFNSGETFSGTFLPVPRVNSQPMPNLINDYYCTDGLPITKSKLYNSATPKNNRDPRLAASVFFKGDVYLTDLQKIFGGNTATKYGQRKYVRTLSSSSTGVPCYSPGGQDFYVLRYADVLLMRAEALIELNQVTEVYTLVDQVRARVNMPSVEKIEGTALSQDQLRNVVRHERRVELALEGLRFFDMKRWGLVAQAYQTIINDKVAGYNPVYRNRQSEMFAVPLTELQANKNLVQDPAWQ